MKMNRKNPLKYYYKGLQKLLNFILLIVLSIHLSNVSVVAMALSTNERCGWDFSITVKPINATINACAKDFASVSSSNSPD